MRVAGTNLEQCEIWSESLKTLLKPLLTGKEIISVCIYIQTHYCKVNLSHLKWSLISIFRSTSTNIYINLTGMYVPDTARIKVHVMHTSKQLFHYRYRSLIYYTSPLYLSLYPVSEENTHYKVYLFYLFMK